MRNSTIRLGVFDLLQTIGEGGMAQVWLGLHREQHVEVAIKVLREDQAQQDRIRQTFLREVQSVARLLHTGIIRIFDYGEVSEEASLASDGQLAAGAPYIAMELATRGSLAELSGVMSWRQMRWMLIETLNALAHAHARNLIHRDLKPENVLLTEGEDGQTCLKLTDFGIVHITDPEFSRSTHDMQSLYAGTPSYMSPEQLRGKWRDFGPWTDLYALGCMAYEQCSGMLPFEGDNLFDIAHKQLGSDPPPIQPRMPVPEGFTDWVMRLLQKDPQDRFQRAADAAWALMQLPSPRDEDASEQPVQLRGVNRHKTLEDGIGGIDQITLVLESAPQHTTQNTLHSDLLSELAQGLLHQSDHGEQPREVFVYQDAPPMPATWHRRKAPPASIQLIGAGLGLYGLREIPFVARELERGLTWQAMQEAYRNNRAMAVVARGSTGIGKSRLINWMGERAHELGTAQIMRARHHADEPPTQGTAQMVARQLNSFGLERPDIFKRLKHILSASATHRDTAELDALALTELVSPATDQDAPLVDGPRAQLKSTRERYIVLARLIEHMCRERPVFLTFDDIHWSVESLEMVKLLITEEPTRNLPIFIAVTVNEDAQSIRPSSKRLIEGLRDIPGVREIRLDPLARLDQRQLVDALLMLEAPLPEEILELSHGNPMFAVQLMGEWIQRDILEPGSTGYRLRADAAPFLPDTLDQLWTTRLSQLVRSVQEKSPRFSEDDIYTALELAATIGQQIPFREWGSACSKHDLIIPGALVNAMIAQGFATTEQASWSFAHDQLRNRLVRNAQESGRWVTLNLSCAAMIDSLYSRDTEGAPERLITHLVEGGAHDVAIEPIFYLIGVYHVRNDFESADHYISKLATLLADLDIGADDERHGKYRQLRCIQLMHTADIGFALERVDKLLIDARDKRWRGVIGDILVLRGRLLLMQGRLVEAQQCCDAASEQFAGLGNQLGIISCFILDGQLQLLQYHIRDAKDYARDAIELCKGLPEERHPYAISNLLGSSYNLLGLAYSREKRYDKATLAMKRSVKHNQEIGNRLGANLSHNNLGDLARVYNNFDAANKFYTDARQMLLEIDHALAALPTLNLGLSLVQQGRFSEALVHALPALSDLQASGYALYLPLAHLVAATCYAAAGSITSWKANYDEAMKLLERSGIIDPDVAACLEICGDILSYDNPAYALDVYPQAIEQRRRTGADEVHLRKLRHRVNLTHDRLPRRK